MTYKLTLTEEQYHHIIQCVEAVHRIACGDLLELKSILPVVPDESLLYAIKSQSFPELAPGEQYKWNGGYRGATRNEKFREAFDKFQAQGYQIWREMEHAYVVAHNIDNVYSSPTLTTDKADKPIIEVIYGKDNRI